MFKYIEKIKEIIDEVEKHEEDTIKETVDLLVKTIKSNNKIYIFGASHAGILAQELYYRAGGLIVINPIFGREISLDNEPISITSKMEQLHGYGRILANKADFNDGDVLILHSVSGRNPVTIELGLEAKSKGVKIVALTNLKYSKSITSRDQSGKLLYQIADIILDNHGDIGDAAMPLEGAEIKVAPTSTVIGAMILNTIVHLTAQAILDSGEEYAPTFFSANLDGGHEKNLKVVEKYKDNIVYRF